MPDLHQGEGGQSSRPNRSEGRNAGHFRRLPTRTGKTTEVRRSAQQAAAARIRRGEMKMYKDDAIWTRKGATLSDKSARQEFGLTQEEIYAAIRAGKLRYREQTCTATRGSGCCGTKSRPWSRKRAARPPSKEETPKGVGRHQQGNPEAESSLKSCLDRRRAELMKELGG